MTAYTLPTVARRKALGLINRADSVGLTVELTPGRPSVVRVTKTELRRTIRRLPRGAKIVVSDVFGQLVFGSV